MKNTIWISTAMLLAGSQQPVGSDSDVSEVTLQVLNPRGEIVLPPVTPPSARVPDLKGKKIGLYWIEKPGGDHFLNGVEQLLKEKLPNTHVLRYSGSFDLGDKPAEKIAKEVDAFIYGVGD